MVGQTVWMWSFQANNADDDHSLITCRGSLTDQLFALLALHLIKKGVVKLSVAKRNPSQICKRPLSHQQFTISIIIVLVHIVLVHIIMALLLLLLHFSFLLKSKH